MKIIVFRSRGNRKVYERRQSIEIHRIAKGAGCKHEYRKNETRIEYRDRFFPVIVSSYII